MDGPDKLRLLERAVTASTNSIVISDPNLPDDPIVYVNPAFEETTGYAAEEALGRNCRFLQGEDRAQPAIAELRTAVREGRQCTAVLRNYRKDGTLFWNELSIYPVLDEEHRVSNFVGVQNDITERIKAEELLAEIRLAERRRIARDLHDVVLQDLAGVLQSLRLTYLQGKGSESGLDLEEELEALGRATFGLRGAVHDLRGENERAFVKSVESLVELNRRLAPDCNIELVIEEGFPNRLRGEVGGELLRVIREALTNARHHSGAKSAAVTLKVQGSDLVAEISDDGQGFAPEGTLGVGLSSMRERAANVDGRLEIESELGQGTSVRLLVPVPQIG